KRLTFLRDLNKGIKSRAKMRLFIYKYVFKKLKPKSHWIFFESFQGKGYSDNPKYIYEYMNSQGYKFKYIWSMLQSTNIPFKNTKFTILLLLGKIQVVGFKFEIT